MHSLVIFILSHTMHSIIKQHRVFFKKKEPTVLINDPAAYDIIYQTRERVFHHISKHREESCTFDEPLTCLEV